MNSLFLKKVFILFFLGVGGFRVGGFRVGGSKKVDQKKHKFAIEFFFPK